MRCRLRNHYTFSIVGTSLINGQLLINTPSPFLPWWMTVNNKTRRMPCNIKVTSTVEKKKICNNAYPVYPPGIVSVLVNLNANYLTYDANWRNQTSPVAVLQSINAEWRMSPRCGISKTVICFLRVRCDSRVGTWQRTRNRAELALFETSRRSWSSCRYRRVFRNYDVKARLDCGILRRID